MVKIKISYENEIEKIKILECLSKSVDIKEKSKIYRDGKYYRIHIKGEQK